MNKILLLLLMSCISWADTPPPGAVNIKGGTDGTKIGNISDALKVNVTNSGGLSTVNQGLPGPSVSPWPVAITSPVPVIIASPLPVAGSLGRTWNLDSVTDSCSSVESGIWDIRNITGTISLPSGASTSSLQSTGNTSLSSIDSKVPSLGQALSAASVPVVLPASQITTLTPPTTVTVTQATGSNLHTQVDSSALPSGAATSANQSTGNTSLASIDTKTPSLGQALSASSVPVVLPAAQITTLTPPTTVTVTQATGSNLHTQVDSSALPSGASTSAKQPALGTAGSASADVISIQGVASMTAVKTDGSGVTQPVSGTVTANAGTNLNTSALALETGGNLATLAGAVSSSKVQTNVAQVAGGTTSTVATGVQKVAVAGSDGTAITQTAAALDVNLKSATNISAGPTFQSTTGNLTSACASGVGCAGTSVVNLNIQAFTAITVQTTGTYAGVTLVFEQSVDNTNWIGVPMSLMPGNGNAPASSAVPGTNATAQYQGAGWASVNFRVRCSTYTSGTAAITIANSSDNPNFWTNAYLMAGTNLIGKVGIDQTTPGTTNAVSISQINSTTALTGGVNGSLGIGGLAAQGASVSGNPILGGGKAISAEETALANGQASTFLTDIVGKLINMPYANKENFVSGCVNTASATNTSVIAAQASGIKIYLLSYSIYNSGASNSLTSFTSGSGGTTIWTAASPTVGGAVQTLAVPVATAAATALFVTTGTASSTQFICASGYTGT